MKEATPRTRGQRWRDVCGCALMFLIVASFGLARRGLPIDELLLHAETVTVFGLLIWLVWGYLNQNDVGRLFGSLFVLNSTYAREVQSYSEMLTRGILTLVGAIIVGCWVRFRRARKRRAPLDAPLYDVQTDRP